MNLIEVDPEKCTRCGICVEACPGGLIRLGEGYPRPLKGADAGCIRCGHCVVICPTGAVTHRDMAPGQCPTLDKTLRITADQCEYLVKGRRSVRVYQEKPIPREVLARLIDVARYAPTGHNSQCVEWLVITRKEDLGRLREIGMDWMRWMMDDQPETAALLALKPMLKRMEAGADPFLRGGPALIVTHAHAENPFAPMACPIALTTLDLFANSMGLGAFWAGLFNRAAGSFPPMAEALGLPPDHKNFASMMTGYPKYAYQKAPLRNPPKITWRSEG